MLKGVVKLIDNSKNTQKEVRGFVTKAVGKSASIMEDQIKNAATESFTQRTGHLRRSIRAHTEGMPFGSAEVRINPVRRGADVNYAVYLEYGTKYMTPKAFIRKGIGRSKKQIKETFREESRKVKDKYRSKK